MADIARLQEYKVNDRKYKRREDNSEERKRTEENQGEESIERTTKDGYNKLS